MTWSGLHLQNLGVIFQGNFKMDLHVNSILSQCNQRFYLLKLLRSQGMSAVQLEQIVQAGSV